MGGAGEGSVREVVSLAPRVLWSCEGGVACGRGRDGGVGSVAVVKVSLALRVSWASLHGVGGIGLAWAAGAVLLPACGRDVGVGEDGGAAVRRRWAGWSWAWWWQWRRCVGSGAGSVVSRLLRCRVGVGVCRGWCGVGVRRHWRACGCIVVV